MIKEAARRYLPYDREFRSYVAYRKLSNALRLAYLWIAYKRVFTYRTLLSREEVASQTILFETFWGRSISCNPYAIYREMKRDPRFDDWTFIWVIQRHTIVPTEVADDPRTNLVKHQSRAYQRALVTTEVLVNNTTFPTHFIRRTKQRYINTYHGIPLKKMGFDIDDTLTSIANTQRNFIQATTLLSGGKYTDLHLYAPYGAMPLFRERILHSGFPRIDRSQMEASLDLKLKTSKTRPTVLFAPTWRGTAKSHRTEAARLIKSTQALCDALEETCDMFVSLHNLVLNSGVPIPKQIRMLPAGVDVNDALSGVDILISDYSSIIVDFLALDRPLILYAPDHEEYMHTRGLSYNLRDIPAPLCNGLDDVIAAVENARVPSDFANYATAISTLLPNQDGQATQRVLDHIFAPTTHQKPTDKKRLLLCMSSLQPNGITTSFLNLTHTIDHESIEVYVIVDAKTVSRFDDNLSHFHKINPQCYPILRIGSHVSSIAERRTIWGINDPSKSFDSAAKDTAFAAFARESRRLVSDTRFDAAVDFTGYSTFWAHMTTATRADRKTIFQHNDLHAEFHNPKKSHQKLVGVFRAYEKADTIAPVSTEIGLGNYENLRQFYASKSQVKPVRNMIDVARIRHLAQEDTDISAPQLSMQYAGSTRKIVTIGRLSPEKNHARLIKAFAKARAEGLNAVLFIVGSGVLYEPLTHLAHDVGQSDHIIFLGQVSNPFPLLKEADCFVLSSDYEGQPMTLLEALTLGTPCIGTDIPGIRAVLGETEATLTALTVQDLAAALYALQDNPAPTLTFDADDYAQTVRQEFTDVVFAQTS